MNLLNKQNTFFPLLMDDFINQDMNLKFKTISDTIPAVNIKELNTEYQIDLAIPGKKKDDFNIEVENNLLSISSNFEEENLNDEEKFTTQEFNYNSFRRTFSIPKSVDSKKIEAKYFEGVLKISLPKSQEALTQSKKIIKIK